jgi:hypothetical protein
MVPLVTKAFLKNAIAFCIEVEQFAPSTRKKGRSVDLRPATLTVKAQRFHDLLRWAENGVSSPQPQDIERYLDEIARLLEEWRDETQLADREQTQVATMLERASLVRSLLRSASLGAIA